MPAVHAPTLLISRAGDRHVRVAHGRHLADHIPGATFIEGVPGEDDFFLAGRTDEILDAAQEFLRSVRPDPVLDRVLASVLFTDIVGSTASAVELGNQRWSELLNS